MGKWDLSALFLKFSVHFKFFSNTKTKTALTDTKDHKLLDSTCIKFYKRQIYQDKKQIND